jgi:hypothetical protein
MALLESHRLREISDILDHVGMFSYKTGDMILSGLCTLKQTSIVLDHGFHEKACEGFTSLAPHFMVAFNDLKATAVIAEYARLLKERAYGQKVHAPYCLVQGSFNLPWFAPWKSCQSLLFAGYENGMRKGQTRDAIYVRCTHRLATAEAPCCIT